MNPKSTFLQRGLLAAAVACAAWGIAVPARAAAFSIEEAFLNSTLPPEWKLMGAAGTGTWTPHLTAGPNPGDDAEGEGWLRLTQNVDEQVGTAVYNKPFSSAQGLQITFDYAAYGGSKADGLAFYLLDGNTTNPTLGYHSATLGYAAVPSPSVPGVTGGYVGIGLDEWGGFSNSNIGNGCTIPCMPNPQSVTVRGAGNLVSGFPLLASVPLSSFGLQVSTLDRANAQTVRITLSAVSVAKPEPTLTVEIDPTGKGTNFVTVIPALKLPSPPATFKLGFSASTGGSNNVHEVRIRRTVKSIPALGQSTLGALAAMLALLTLPALRRRVRN
ncbi:MAG: hypothetical protein LBP52_02075 [Burkholderiaceae bacterium]|nr:hypothetical protein [Burkholderiaceae bacterium]